MNARSNGRRASRQVAQVVGFAVGVALIVWCLRRALGGDGAEALRRHVAAAPTWLLVALAGTSLASLLANGTLFWLLIRPVRALGFGAMQAVNAMASFLNYAPLPVRLGLLARIAYHWRVDVLAPTTIAALLFAALLGAGICFAGTAAALAIGGRAGIAFLALAATGISLLGAALAGWLAGQPKAAARLGSAAVMVGSFATFLPATALRLLDMAAWATRMVLAAILLDVPLSHSEAALLGIAAVVASMNPFGRIGFREAAVTWLAGTLFAGRLEGHDLDTAFAQLAIVESAAEGVVMIPLGGAATLWCWRRMSSTRSRD